MQKTLKIGIYLGSPPGSGGMFQYGIAVLDALATLKNIHHINAAYEDIGWKPYLDARGIAGRHLDHGKGLGWCWGRLCLPLWLWNAGVWRLDKSAQFFARSGMDYWMFPGQDHWTYLSRQPAIGVVHDLMHRYESQFPEVSSCGRYWLREYRFKHLCRAARIILVDSEVGKRQVIESYGVQENKIFPLPYIPPAYIYSHSVPDDFDRRYSLPRKYFFYPAQFWPHKNHIRLLQAMAQVKSDCPGLHLVLAGPKKHAYEAVFREVTRLGLQEAVTFIGYVPDDCLPELYRRARALVMPTFFGPTNIPPLEAQELGCPVMISGTYGMPEQLGDTAVFVEPGSTESIANALKLLWNDDKYCTSLSEKGVIRAANWKQPHFSARLRDILQKM